MASRIAEAYVQVVPRIDGVQASLTKQLNGEMTKAGDAGGKSIGNGVGAGLKKMKGVIGAAIIGLGIADFFGDVVKGASNFQAEFEGVNQTFGTSAKAVQDFAKAAATSAGISEVEALRAAKSMGVFAKSAGLAGTDASSFATDMVQLAGDLGSFNDVPTEEALAAIQSGLMGQAEPLRRFGVLIDDATLRQRALSMGLISTTKDALSPQNKVLAAQAEIMAQTNLQQGDFVKYASDFGNAQKTMTANFQNMQATIGSAILPVLGQLVAALNPVIEKMGPVLFDVFQKLIPLFELVTKTIGDIIPIIDPLVEILGVFIDVAVDILEAVLPSMIQLFEALLPAIVPLAQLFAKLVSSILPPLVKIFDKVLMPILLFLIDILVKYLIPYWSWLADILGGAVTKAADLVVAGFQNLMKFLKPVWDFLKPFIEGLMSFAGIKPIKVTVAAGVTGADAVERLAANKKALESPIKIPSIGSANIGASASTSATSNAKTIKKALKGFNDDVAKANKKYTESVSDANKKFAEDTAKINTDFSKKVTEITSRRDDDLAKAAKSNASAVLQIQKDFAQRMADIVSQSKARLRDAFESVANVDVGKTFADLTTKNVTNLVNKLKTQLAGAKSLITNAGALASAGFSQTFIEQVVAQGPDAGNAMAKAILASSPQAQQELQTLFAESEVTAQTGMDSLTDALYEKSGLANQALKDMYAQATLDLSTALDTQATLYTEQQAEIQKTFNDAIAEAKISRDEALAEAEKALNEALTAATKALNESLDAIQKAFNEKLKEFKGQLAGHAKAIQAIKDEISAARAEAMKPIVITRIENVVVNRAVVPMKPFADGGFVNGPVNALIGEAGPEVVTPLRDFERMMGLTDSKDKGNTLNYYAAPNESLDAEQQLLQAMRRAKAVGTW
jgi:hypothetical protein